MTKEVLEKANNICSEIDRLKANLKQWESSRGIKSITLETNCCTRCSIKIDSGIFEDMKSLATTNIKKSIEELEAEFERL